jgi:hypothetical protein
MICVLKRMAMHFYTNLKLVPLCKILLPIIKEKNNFPWDKQSLRIEMHKVGFKWKKCQGRRTV